ncbi:T-complex protein 11-domain-containing protein [Peziza echinospora]|nr:T-complex protein 11-domain-containing protein [Peziza echinospora]
MSEKHKMLPIYLQLDNDYDTNNTTAKPMDITTESKPDAARPANAAYDYETPPAGPAPVRSPSTKRPAAQSEIMTIRPKRPRHENEVVCQNEGADAPKPQLTPAESRPAQPMARAASAHHKTSPSSRVRPRAHSLPARLGGRNDWVALQYVDRQLQHMPPVNLKTLRELELSEFYRNPKLRHDVVFDAQLHFRPNNDGTRGMRKKVDSQGYWQMVLVECDILLSIANKKGSTIRPQERPMKIPVLLSTMRDILLTLVPRADREEVESSLDPDLLMQQLEHGILDLKRMSMWLARIFKAHCAPMRDQWVDQMVSHFERGVDRGDARSLMEGWKSIFGILEAMKLDVANHQIRTLRPHLISTAVVFEQSYFQSRIETRRLETQVPKLWYQEFFSEYKAKTGSEDHVDCFMRATLDMVAPSKAEGYHNTFVFDYERLDCLKEDIREETCLRLCNFLYRQLAIGAKREIEEKDMAKLGETISAVLSEEVGMDKYAQRSADVALSIAHIACGGLIPSAAVVKVAENWLAKHLDIDSPIYRATENTVTKEIIAAIQQNIKGWSSPATFPIAQVADNTQHLTTIKSIAQRLSNIAYLHWQVFGKLVYLADGSEHTSDHKLDYNVQIAAAMGGKESWCGDRFTSS